MDEKMLKLEWMRKGNPPRWMRRGTESGNG
jgi:hypothetical protein